MIMQWLRRWNKSRRADRWQRGYDFAAGELLRGIPIDYVEMQSEDMFDHNDFNEGMCDAVRDWERRAHPVVIAALKRSLNWLSSYPGGCANNAYEQAVAALKAIGEY